MSTPDVEVETRTLDPRSNDIPTRTLASPSATADPVDEDRNTGALPYRMLGHFVVLGILGKGGMGTVYEAFDRTLDRRIAVKVLRHDVGRQHARRLVREAQALAQLSHPNVVHVYEVGEVEGQTFVAMELVQGQTLRQWMWQEPRPDWRRCIEIYLQAGAGLVAAHAQGLIHRDFKPSNAIVDDQGRVRVVDFGLARTIEDRSDGSGRGVDSPTPLPSGASGETRPIAPLTETGLLMGTPAYMSPEQLRQEPLDTSSDQFSFCVALYEAIYGWRPFVGRKVSDLLAAIEQQRFEPAPKDVKVPARLRQVLLRGLASEPMDRWPSLGALQTELRRLVAPRRWSGLVMGLAGVLAIGGGVFGYRAGQQETRPDQRCSGASTQLEAIWNAERRRQVEGAILATGMSHAPGTWARVEQRLDDYTTAWADKHTEICEATAIRQEQSTEVMDLRMDCLGERRVALRAALGALEQVDTPAVSKAVNVVVNLPRLDRCDDVEALRAKLAPPDAPGVALQVETLRKQLADVVASHALGQYERANEQSEAIAEQAEVLGYAPLMAEVKLQRGICRATQGRYAESEQDLRQAYGLALEHGHDEVARAAANQLVFVVGYWQARTEEGLLWGETALPLARSSGDDAKVAESLSSLGAVLVRQGKFDRAEERHQRALQLRQSALEPDHPFIANSLHNLGDVMLQQGDYEQAKLYHQSALHMRQRLLGADHPRVSLSLNQLGRVMLTQGNYEDAEHYLRRALELRQRAMGDDHPEVAAILHPLGDTLAGQGRYEDSERYQRRALQIWERALGTENPTTAWASTSLANVYSAQGKYEEAERHYRRALRVSEAALGPEHPTVAFAANNLGNMFDSQGKYDQAEHHYRRALQVSEAALGPEHPKVAFPLVGLARAALARNDPGTAREYAERAVALRLANDVAPEHLAFSRFELARALWFDRSERPRALALAQQARDVFAQLDAGRAHDLARTEAWLAEHHQ